MALPTTAISRVEMSVGHREFDLEASRRGFVGPQILRPRVVGLQAADVASVPVESLLADRNLHRAPGAGYSRGDFEFSTVSFSCRERGAEEVLDDATLAIFRNVLDAEAIHTGRAIDAVLRRFERDVASTVFDTDTFSGDLTTGLTHEWDDSENAVPIDDVATAKQTVHDRCGCWPNALVLNQQVFNSLSVADQILERIAYGNTGAPSVVTRDVLSQCFGLNVIVASGTYNAANEGQALEVKPIWSDEYAMVCRVAESDDWSEAALGRTFLWAGDGATDYSDQELSVIVEEYREEGRRGSVIRARSWWDAQILIPSCGQLLSNVTTT